jgi:hypothetical protein
MIPNEMKPRIFLQILGWLCAGTVAANSATIKFKPAESLDKLREQLASNAELREVIFEEGVYSGHLHVSAPKGADFSAKPLLIRAADGAKVVFDGSRALDKFEPHPGLPGVFQMDYTHRGGEYPKLWEPNTRARYRVVADIESVKRFSSTFTVDGNRLFFRTSDGQPPLPGQLLMSAHDCGMFINRPHVTVRGIAFQNYLVREKWSTGIDLRVDHITVEDCSTRNCSLGFVVSGNNNTVRRCSAEDIGGGVYVGGANATVEECRLFKQRVSKGSEADRPESRVSHTTRLARAPA